MHPSTLIYNIHDGSNIHGSSLQASWKPYKQTSRNVEHCQKLAPKFYSPYTILNHVGQVAYQLDFTNHSKLHHVFHVSCLKKVVGAKCQIQTNLPELAEEGSIWLQTEVVLD
jgi:hypothetical protein